MSISGRGDLKPNHIGVMRESSLHAALKDWYAQPGDELEALVDGYRIDIVQNGWLVEIQTGNFSALKAKLAKLLPYNRLLIIYPISLERWICRVTSSDEKISRRKSPKRGRVEDLFTELVRIPELACHPNFFLDVLMIREEIVWKDDGQGSWRRKGWSVADRRLLEVVNRIRFGSCSDYTGLLPANLSQPFTNNDLSLQLGIRRSLAGKMTYCLRKMGMLEVTGRQGRAHLFRLEQSQLSQ